MPTETRKLVKARVKKAEHFPDWALCCPEFVAHFTALPDMALDLSTVWRDARAWCGYCGSHRPEIAYAEDIADKMGVHLELVDLDEGAYTDAH